MNVHGSSLSRDDAHALAQGGGGRHIDDLRRIDVDHSMIGRHDSPHARRQRPEQAREPGIELFQIGDPTVRTDARSVARVVDLRPVQVHNGRAGAQFAQGSADALIKRLCGHVTCSPQGCPRQTGARETRRGDDRRSNVRGGQALKVRGDRLPLAGRRTALHGEQVHDGAPICDGKAHHVRGARTLSRPKGGDRRCRRRGDHRMNRTNIASHAAQRRSVSHVLLNKLIPEAIHEDQKQLVGARLHTE